MWLYSSLSHFHPSLKEGRGAGGAGQLRASSSLHLMLRFSWSAHTQLCSGWGRRGASAHTLSLHLPCQSVQPFLHCRDHRRPARHAHPFFCEGEATPSYDGLSLPRVLLAQVLEPGPLAWRNHFIGFFTDEHTTAPFSRKPANTTLCQLFLLLTPPSVWPTAHKAHLDPGELVGTCRQTGKLWQVLPFVPSPCFPPLSQHHLCSIA